MCSQLADSAVGPSSVLGAFGRMGDAERPEAWSEVMLVAIPKKTDKVGFRAMPYISLLPVLQQILRSCPTDSGAQTSQHKHSVFFVPGR